MVTELELYDDTDSAWMIAFQVMPGRAQEAWRTLADRVGVDLRFPDPGVFEKIIDHHRLFPADPAVDEILAMGLEESGRRAN